MTILNQQSDGLYSILITLATTLFHFKALEREDLINLCSPKSCTDSTEDASLSKRVRATLNRWISLCLFIEESDSIRLFADHKRNETLEQFAGRLPSICRDLVFRREAALPLWPTGDTVSEDNIGKTADICRSLSWCLAQNIYSLPRGWSDIENLTTSQTQTGKFIFLNNTRWPGLLAWARFLGFATGEDSRLLFDPTNAIRETLRQEFNLGEETSGQEFLTRLAIRLPVIDTGQYRLGVENALRPESWTSASGGDLSTSLSIALRRLQKIGMIRLNAKADAGTKINLVGQNGRKWDSFTHVVLVKDLG